MRLKTIEIRIHLIIYIKYNKSIIINVINLKIMLPKFLGPIAINKK